MKLPKRHVFVCVAKYCKENKSEAIYDRLRALVREKGLKEITVTGCGSVGLCDVGPALIVYPEGVWYVEVKEQDLGEILEQHLIKGQPVERLRLRPDHPEEERRRAFYRKLMPKENFAKEEVMKLAEQDGFSSEWMELQINTGFLEAAGENTVRVSNKARGRYGS